MSDSDKRADTLHSKLEIESHPGSRAAAHDLYAAPNLEDELIAQRLLRINAPVTKSIDLDRTHSALIQCEMLLRENNS
jgi:hypothetical protein